MIKRVQATFSAVGEHFTPSKVTAPFTSAHNPGEIGTVGRFRGVPEPQGYASFDAPENEPDKIAFLHRIVKPLLPALREAGAEDFSLMVSYDCDSESVGFSMEEVKMLADLECDVPINYFYEEPTEPAS